MPSSPSLRLPRGLILLGALILWLATAYFAYHAWVHGADHRDFYPRWAGVRRVLAGERDLYSAEATRAMQIQLYGAPIPAGRDQQGFAYPAQLAVLLLPFGLIPDVEIATALWQGLSLLMLAGAFWALRASVSHRLPPGLLLALAVWNYPLLMLFQGQITALLCIILAGAAALFLRRRDALAGAVLALGVVKPELIALPALAFLWLAVRERRWRFLWGLAGGSLGLFLVSVALAGWWIPGWLNGLSAYAGYARVVWAPAELWRMHPAMALGVLAFALGMVWRGRQSLWGLLGAGIPAGMLVFPQTLLWGLTLLTLPLLLAYRRGGRAAVWLIWILGWTALFIQPLAEWWKVQAVGMPVLTLGALWLADAPEK
ncbi:glycosyltransferase family 87 protein [Anaerolinea thermophila]|uniref:Hypothetical membrane protein n=1 Tax=Anaerolinea thermophila (strain DSM 14523 / JCM 11388 / NBRC 100420 / UNI-1) TaxID=926569 RepID=E8N287_ANATU|nr:glycosyltransferase family 87 protein [Anaerolinea thermophila]BAJ65034.1 hypothetical membrane protein [Anaerolinea thermophila UNI-1]